MSNFEPPHFAILDISHHHRISKDLGMSAVSAPLLVDEARVASRKGNKTRTKHAKKPEEGGDRVRLREEEQKACKVVKLQGSRTRDHVCDE